MKRFNKENGMTLVEVLATITILFIIGGIAYAMLFQMFTNVSHSEQRISARQEANLILAHLTTVHQKSTSYTIERDGDDPEHFFTVEDETGVLMKLGNRHYTYTLEMDSTILDEGNTPFTIDLRDSQNKELDVKLTLESNFDSVVVQTTISRMTESN